MNFSAFSERIILTDFDSPLNPADSIMGGTAPLDLEGLPAAGDSGGGAMFFSIGGQNAVAGVLTFIDALDEAANSDYGDYAGFTRVSPFVDWINSNIPEPTSGGLLSLGGATAVMFRRRHIQRR